MVFGSPDTPSPLSHTLWFDKILDLPFLQPSPCCGLLSSCSSWKTFTSFLKGKSILLPGSTGSIYKSCSLFGLLSLSRKWNSGFQGSNFFLPKKRFAEFHNLCCFDKRVAWEILLRVWSFFFFSASAVQMLLLLQILCPPRSQNMPVIIKSFCKLRYLHFAVLHYPKKSKRNFFAQSPLKCRWNGPYCCRKLTVE